MALNTMSPLTCCLSISSQCLRPSSSGTSCLPFFHGQLDAKIFHPCPPSICTHHAVVAYSGAKDGIGTASSESCLLDDDLLRRILKAVDAQQILETIAEAKMDAGGGTVENEDCRLIITAAFDGRDVELALSVFYAMLSGRAQAFSGMNEAATRWGWARPDVQTYALLVRRLASCLRVSDAVRIIGLVSGSGVASADEVSFGMIVHCPICMLAIAVAQPQHGIQVASCSKCRYQYELVSGDICSIDSEATSMDTSAWERVLRLLRTKRDVKPASIHSIVVRIPSGIARTNKFASKTVELPAQEGERVTIVLAAPSNLCWEIGPLKLSAKPPGLRPGEPMSLTNHTNGKVSRLLRAPQREDKSFLSNPSVLFTSLAVLASGDAASGFIDPSLPRLISIVAVASLAVGTTVSRAILPQLSKVPVVEEINALFSFSETVGLLPTARLLLMLKINGGFITSSNGR